MDIVKETADIEQLGRNLREPQAFTSMPSSKDSRKAVTCPMIPSGMCAAMTIRATAKLPD